MDPQQRQRAEAAGESARAERDGLYELSSQHVNRHGSARWDREAATATFRNWTSTRQATARPEQDQELIERTRQLDALWVAEREARAT